MAEFCPGCDRAGMVVGDVAISIKKDELRSPLTDLAITFTDEDGFLQRGFFGRVVDQEADLDTSLLGERLLSRIDRCKSPMRNGTCPAFNHEVVEQLIRSQVSQEAITEPDQPGI